MTRMNLALNRSTAIQHSNATEIRNRINFRFLHATVTYIIDLVRAEQLHMGTSHSNVWVDQFPFLLVLFLLALPSNYSTWLSLTQIYVLKRLTCFSCLYCELEQLPNTTVCEVWKVFNKARFGIMRTALMKGI